MRKRSIAGLGALVLLALSGCSEPVEPVAGDEECLDKAYVRYSLEEGTPTVDEVRPGSRGLATWFNDIVQDNEYGVCETTRIISDGSGKQPTNSAFSEWYYGLDEVTPNESGTCNFVVGDEVVTEPCVPVNAGDDPKFKNTLLAEVSGQYLSGDWGDDALGSVGYYKIGSREPAVD